MEVSVGECRQGRGRGCGGGGAASGSGQYGPSCAQLRRRLWNAGGGYVTLQRTWPRQAGIIHAGASEDAC